MRRIIVGAAVVAIAALSLSARTPPENLARQEFLRATASRITGESQRAAGGDWDRWYGQLSVFRSDFRAMLATARQRMVAFKANPGAAPSGLIRTSGPQPIYDLADNAAYIAPDDPHTWLTQRPSRRTFIQVSQWLERRNIDLLVVPAPRIAEIYADRMVGSAPSDRMVAPQMRKFILDLVNAGVEVVDLLPRLLAARDADAEPLYLQSDGHWSDRGQRIAAAEIGRHLKRYDFVTAALARPPLFTATATTVSFPGAAFELLTPAERAQIKASVSATRLTKITQGRVPFTEPAESPVLVIGDSFTHYFQLAVSPGSGIDALLSKEINLAVSNVSSAGATVDPIKEFLRRPALLRGRRAIVWIVTNAIVSYDSRWELPPLPEQ